MSACGCPRICFVNPRINRRTFWVLARLRQIGRGAFGRFFQFGGELFKVIGRWLASTPSVIMSGQLDAFLKSGNPEDGPAPAEPTPTP